MAWKESNMMGFIQNPIKSLFHKEHPFVEKDSLYFEITDAFETKGCPVCHLLDRYEDQYMEALFYESVNDGNIRMKMEQSQGLCPLHTQKFLKAGDILGLSILGADLIEEWLIALDRNNVVDTTCLLCEQRSQTERRLNRAFARYFYLKEFRDAFEHSAGLCKKHFHQIQMLIKDQHLADEFIKIEEVKIKKLIANLYEVIRKHDYRFQNETIFDRETEAIRRVWEFLKK